MDVGATYVHLEEEADSSEVVRSGWMAAGEEMKVILVSRSIPVDVVCQVATLDDGLTTAVVDALRGMHETENGEQILGSLLGVTRFATVDPRDYDVVRAALNVAHLPIIGDD